MPLTTLAALTEAEKNAVVAGGVAGAVVSTTLICALVFYVLTVIATWKIFKKAGEPGWKSLIPIYNIYIMFKIVNMKSWFWWMIIIYICASIMVNVDLPNLATMSDADIQAIDWSQHPMSIIAAVANLVVDLAAMVVYSIRTSKVFGHGAGYAIGIFFLPNIFWLILGFGKSKYSKKALKK